MVSERYADRADDEFLERFFLRLTEKYERIAELFIEIGHRDQLYTEMGDVMIVIVILIMTYV